MLHGGGGFGSESRSAGGPAGMHTTSTLSRVLLASDGMGASGRGVLANEVVALLACFFVFAVFRSSASIIISYF